ncbi:MAG: hypothetical protein GTO08_05400, partial [Deltaproteobacteria bacterium]|nr:hypothetical protein [Deltaproteobacteria bacterium]
MNKQRTEIYSFRRDILSESNLKDKILEMAESVIQDLLSFYCPDDRHPEEWDISGLRDALYRDFSLSPEGTEKESGELF